MKISARSKDVIIALSVSVLYMLVLAVVIPMVLSRPPSWWTISANRWIASVSWDQLTHTVSLLVIAWAASLLVLASRPVSISRVAWLIAALSLLGFIGSTVYDQQTNPISALTLALMWEAKSIPLAIFILDGLKICVAVPFMLWLLQRKPSNPSLQARRP